MCWRKIWESYHGPIPKDEHGRTFEIHHKDGDRGNNEIDNLLCVSIEEHYLIHFEQNEFRACILIASRLKDPVKYKEAKEYQRRESSEFQKNLVRTGKHHLQSGVIQSRTNRRRVKLGIHNFQDGTNTSLRNKKMVEEGTHHFLTREDGGSVGGDSSRKRIRNGTHHFQDSERQRELSYKARQTCLKPVLRISLDGEVVEYEGVSVILEENPDYKSTIYRKIADEKEYKGYKWMYKQ